jgi:hypothetical protein
VARHLPALNKGDTFTRALCCSAPMGSEVYTCICITPVQCASGSDCDVSWSPFSAALICSGLAAVFRATHVHKRLHCKENKLQKLQAAESRTHAASDTSMILTGLLCTRWCVQVTLHKRCITSPTALSGSSRYGRTSPLQRAWMSRRRLVQPCSKPCNRG